MRKYIFSSLSLALIILSVGLFSSCGDSTTDNPVTTTTKGSIYVTSSPSGATIYVNGTSQNKVTPDTVSSLEAATYSVTLKLTGYKDTTFTVTVTANSQTTPSTVTLNSNASLTSFGPVTIWETTGTNSSEPSGLCLYNGLAYGLSSSDNGKIDLFYFSQNTTYEVRSASLASSLSRATNFLRGPSSNLSDGVSASVFNSTTWFNVLSDHDSTSYFFVYDNDKHYSKLKIVNWGGGTVGNPAWVQVSWIYNNTVDDIRFK
jgi:hypothetical protein